MINYTSFIGLGLLLLCVYAQVRPPNFSPDSIPETSFTCEDKITGGYYADIEADCQLFHVCVQVSEFEFQDFRFLCPNDTVFDQQNLVCTNWFEVDCVQSVTLFSNDFGFKDLSGRNNDEDADKSNFNYNDGISYEYYEYESDNQDEKRNRFLVNSSPASLKGNLGVGREHGQGFLGGDGKIRAHSTTAIPVGVTTTKRPPRVKSNINLAKNNPKKHGGFRRKPSHRFRNPFKNPPKKAVDGRRPRVKSDLRQKHHGGNVRFQHSKKNKLGKKVKISKDKFKFADPIDNDIFSGPEVRPDGRPPRVKSNINAIENHNNIPSGFPSSTPHAFHFIPTEPTTEAFQPTPFENEESFNTIEFSSDLFPSSTSQPFIQQQHSSNNNHVNINQRQGGSSHSQSRFNEQHRSNGANEVRSFNRQSSFNNKNANGFVHSTTQKPFIGSTTRKPFSRSSTVQPPIISSTTRKPFVSSTTQRSFVSSQSTTFKVPFISQESSISSTAKPFIQDSKFKVPFITKENNAAPPPSEAKRNKFKVPFLSKQNLSPPKGSKNFRSPFVSDKEKFSNNQQTRIKFSSAQGSKFRPPFISNDPNSIGSTIKPSTFNQGFSTTKSTNFNGGFSTSRPSSNFNGGFSTSRPSSNFNQGFSTSRPSSNSNQGFSTVSPSSFDQRFSALANSFSSTSSSSSGFRHSSTTKRSIHSTTESPFKSSTSGSFFNVAFTTRSPGSQPRVKSDLLKGKELSLPAADKSQVFHQSTARTHSSHQSTFNSPNIPKFIDEIDEFEVPQSSISPLPSVASTTARPQRTRKRVTVRRKVVRKNKFGNNVRARGRNQPIKTTNFNRQNAQNTQSINNKQTQIHQTRNSQQKEQIRSQGISQQDSQVNNINSQNSQTQKSFSSNAGSQVNHQTVDPQQQQNNNFQRAQVNLRTQQSRPQVKTFGAEASNTRANANSQNSQAQKSFSSNAESQVNHKIIGPQRQQSNNFQRAQTNLRTQQGRTKGKTFGTEASNVRTKLPKQFAQHQQSDVSSSRKQVSQEHQVTQKHRTQHQSLNANNNEANFNSQAGRTRLQQKKTLIIDEDESFNDITAPGSVKERECNDPFKCPPKKRAGGHRPRVKSNIRAKNRNFHFKHKLGRKIQDSNTVRRNHAKPNPQNLVQQVNRQKPPLTNRPKPPQQQNFVQQTNRQEPPVNNRPKPPQQQKNIPKPSPPKGKLPNKPLNKNQFLSFLSSIGNASPIITVNSKTGKLSTFPHGFSGSTKGISSSSIQSKVTTLSPPIHSTSQPFFSASSTTLKPGSHTSLSSTFSRNSFQSSPRPSLSKSNINDQFQSSPRPRLSNSFSSNNNNRIFQSTPSPIISSTSSFSPNNRFTPGPSTFATNSNFHSSPRPKLSSSSFNSINRFQSSPRPSLVSTTERFIASSTVLSFSTTPSISGQKVFIGSTTQSPQFSSPRSASRSPPRSRFNGFKRSKLRRNRPAPFTKTFSPTSRATFPSSTTQVSSTFVSAAENEIIPISSTLSPVTPPPTSPKNPIFLPPTPANKILTINDIIHMVATESPQRKPRVKSNILLAQRNSGRRSRKIGGRRADIGDNTSELNQIKKSATEDGKKLLNDEKKNELFFASSSTPSTFHVSSTTKRSISPEDLPPIENKVISTTKTPLVVTTANASKVPKRNKFSPYNRLNGRKPRVKSNLFAKSITTTQTPPSPSPLTQKTQTTSTSTTTASPQIKDVKEELMELHKNMTDIDSKIEYNNKNDKEPVVRPDGQKPRVKSNLLFNSSAKKRSDRNNLYRPNSRPRTNRFSFNKLKSAIKSRPIPGKTTTTTESTSSTPFSPTIPTEESSITSSTTSSSTIPTTTTPNASSSKAAPTPRSPYRFQNKKPRNSNSFLEKFLAKHRRRKGFSKNVKTESTTTSKPSTPKDSVLSDKSTTTVTTTTTTTKPVDPSTTTAVPSDIVR